MKKALLSLNAPEYKDLLAKLYSIDGFEPADDSEYDPVRAAVETMGVTVK